MKSPLRFQDPVKLPVYQNFLIAEENTGYSSLNNLICRALIIDESQLTQGAIKAFKDANDPLGCSVGLHPKDQTISALALCTSDNRCLVIEFTTQLGLRKDGQGTRFDTSQVRAMIQDVLCRPPGLYAFDLAPLALALYRELGIRVTNAVDIQSAFPKHRMEPVEAISAIIGHNTGIRVEKDRIVSANDLTYSQNSSVASSLSSRTNLVQRAWISQFLAGFENAPDQFSTIRRVDTTAQVFSNDKLDILSKWAADSVRLQYMKPVETEHAVTGITGSGTFEARSMLYKNKLRRDQEIELTIQNEHATFSMSAHTGGVEGRRAVLNLPRDLGHTNQIVGKVISRGRDGPTKADEKRAEAVLRMLQGEEGLFENPWIVNLWCPPDGVMSWPDSKFHKYHITVPEAPERLLNASQISAIEKMLSFKNEDHIILIRGPPGSGKTSFVEIAAASEHHPGIWLIAQSNIAVKNIAEKLASIGFMNWRLLVSKDFIYEWHEHLYGSKFQNNLISSDQFITLSKKVFAGCKHIPIHTLIVDEASQIEVGNFLPVLISAGRTLQKLCLIGDDKQLPPHGQEEIQDLKSVFEIEHLHNHVYLLDTQYRMPPQMGDFISSRVYNGNLKSNPHHIITDRIVACHFVNASGVEKTERDSYINISEALAVIKLSEFLETSGKSYRVVTPYDSQRNYIEELMKSNKKINWKNKCFNVDSFQGNEDDYIIISVVRSYRPGFLTNPRRTNVMLTRFKKGMFIVTSKKFISRPNVAETLVAKLADYFVKKVGEAAWLDEGEIGSRKITLT